MQILRKLVREPLLHFLLIGAAIFAVYTLLAEPEPRADAGKGITIRADQVDQLVARFRETWRRAPTRGELDGLLQRMVREEVLVREARALSMETGDSVIRQRLTQKMDFLMQSAAGAQQPTEAELAAFFEANQEEYTSSMSVGFQQVFLGERPSDEDVAAAQAALATGADPRSVGVDTMLPPAMRPSAQGAVDGVYGTGFFAGLAEVAPGDWAGPLRSGFGLHLVRVIERSGGETPALEAVRDRVQADWIQAKVDERTEEFYDQLRDAYAVTLPAEAEIEAALQ